VLHAIGLAVPRSEASRLSARRGGDTYDPATPDSEAISMLHTWDNARLLTIHGNGHADGGVSSACADTRFIVATMPSAGDAKAG
jgi:hypothetical protein